MPEIELHGRLNPAALEEGAYVSSLLTEGLRAGALDEAGLEVVQLALLSLLAQRTQRYTGGESSSVRIEAAQALMDSNLFLLGLCLQEYPTPNDALQDLAGGDVFALYARGRKLVDSRVRAAKARHQRLLDRMVPLPNEFYLGTVREGITGFFRVYDPDFTAQEIHITADYPVSQYPVGVYGIVFIQRYLDGLIRENEFLSQFQPVVLCGMLDAYLRGWRAIPMNLYEPILTSALGCLLTGEDPLGLSIPPQKARLLQAALLGKSRSELNDLIAAAAEVLLETLALSAATGRYVRASLPKVTGTLSAALEGVQLERILPQTSI